MRFFQKLFLLLIFLSAGQAFARVPAIKIKKKGYEFHLQPTGFQYAFKTKGKNIAGFHTISGLRFSAPGDTVLYDVTSTAVISKKPDLLQLEVKNTQGHKAAVSIYLYADYLNFKVKPIAPNNTDATNDANFVIDIRTAPVQPAYGLGDHGGYGPGTNVFGFANNRFLNTDNGLRFVSSFAIFPAQGLGQVIFENGHKRIGINRQENKMGATKVSEINAYYFFGTPTAIYKNYAAVKRKEGYPDLKPKYDFFELGYEAFGSLGWNTYQTSVEKDLETYLEKGYKLKWAIVGSGFWKGERKKPTEGTTNSFRIWDDTAGPGRQDGLPNPRYPDVEDFKAFFRKHQIQFLIGLRTNFKAPVAEGGFYDATNNGPYTPQGLANHYFLENKQGQPIPYKVNFPLGNIYILNPDKPAAVNWFLEGYKKWGVNGYKEDMMLHDGVKLNNDAKLNKVNEALMQHGQLVMVRNAAFSVPGDIIRLEDTKHGFDQDRPVINALNYAASGASNVYPDIVAGKYLTLPLTPDQKLYFIRNAMFSAVSPVMSVGLGPWHLENPAYEAVVKKAADWHNQLAPYIYSAAVESFNSGYPFTMTPLPITFPDDATTYDLASKTNRQYAWLLGPSLLVTPAYGDDYATVQNRNVYLPKGKWLDWETGELFQGPVTLPNYAFPYAKVPAFIGGKGVIVTEEKEGLFAMVYPVAAKGSVYTFTYPDGKSQSLIKNQNRGWNRQTLKIIDTTTGKPVAFTYKEKHKAFAFPIVPGHQYELKGGK